MPKAVELTIEIEVQKVSCPGVWLCQDGRVSLTVFALGTSYQTCLLPPVFPLSFRDVFYFRKRFQEGCSLNNICCMLKDETIYFELVQWSYDCTHGECMMLAQYLGSLNDVLFPSNVCSSDGVDLLMKRTKDFPGILSPKIEIATKVRVDEIQNYQNMFNSAKVKSCDCKKGQDLESPKHRQVCHSAQYHRSRCNQSRRVSSRSRSRSKSSCKSYCSLTVKDDSCQCSNQYSKSRPNLSARPSIRPRCDYGVYSVDTSGASWKNATDHSTEQTIRDIDTREQDCSVVPSESMKKHLIESRYIDFNQNKKEVPPQTKLYKISAACVCEICKRYNEIFHANKQS